MTLTIADDLAARGFGHRRPELRGFADFGKREVFRLSDGAVVGRFFAEDAVPAVVAFK